MAFSKLHTDVIGLGHLHPTSSSCSGPDNATPSPPRTRLQLQLPPSRRPTTSQQLHLQPQQQQKPIAPCTPTKPIKSGSNSNENNDNRAEAEAVVPSVGPPSRRNTGGCASDILRLFDTLGLPVGSDLYVSLIKECTLQRDKASALRLHAHFTNLDGILNKQAVPFLNRLLLMYVSCGQLYLARQLFDQMPGKRDVISWAIIVTGYSRNAQYEESIRFFIQMLRHDYSLLHFSRTAMMSVLKACVYAENQGLGKQLHGLLLKYGRTCADDSSLGASSIECYGNFGSAESAHHVLDQLAQCNNQAIWVTKMENSFREGCFGEVIQDFNRMGRDGICRNSVLFIVLRACAKMDDGGMTARQVHAIAIKQGLEGKVALQCGLIRMYGGCGMVQDSKWIFEMINDEREDAHWNAILTCYLHNGFYVEAFKFLYQMKATAIEVTETLVNRVRIACGTGMLRNNVQ